MKPKAAVLSGLDLLAIEKTLPAYVAAHPGAARADGDFQVEREGEKIRVRFLGGTPDTLYVDVRNAAFIGEKGLAGSSAQYPTLKGSDLAAMEAALAAYQQKETIDLRDHVLYLTHEEGAIEISILRRDRPFGARGGPGYEVRLDEGTLAVASEQFIR